MHPILIVILKMICFAFIGTVITGNLLGTYKQQVGKTFVFATWKGIQYFRKWVKGTYSRTVAQAAQRTMFASVFLLTSQVLPSIAQKFWKKYAVKMSAYNAFMKYNLLNQAKPTVISNWIFSKGTLTPTPYKTITYDTATGVFSATWLAPLLGNQSATDTAVLIIMTNVDNIMAVVDTGVMRSAGVVNWTGPTGQEASSYYAYLFFYRDLSTQFEKISNSVGHITEEA
jgi:hypothetical protein